MAVTTVAAVNGEHAYLALTDCFSNWTASQRGSWWVIRFQHHSAAEVNRTIRELGITGRAKQTGVAP